MTIGIRIALGVAVRDLPRYLFLMLRSDEGYLALRNWYERLDPSRDGRGYRCDWLWTSDLHAPKVLPMLGRWLMRRGLSDHPIRRLSQPELASEQPEVSFIIGHRGTARLPHLLATLESIAGQQGASFECLVVAQDTQSVLSERLPAWVRLIHTPPPTADMPYCRSWTFNIAAKHARGRVLVLHDGDMLIPEDYAAQIMLRLNQGYEVVNLKRFIFYLNETHTQAVLDGHGLLTDQAPETIVQNLEAGGSVAIERDAYHRIGGMDESFIGWGGEDNEFWERAQTCKVWPYGYLHLVHLWHPSQPGKHDSNNRTLEHYRFLSSRPASDRIQRLRALPAGSISGPVGYEKAGSL